MKAEKMNYKFVFIVGCQRTGTTLIGNILGAHSQAFLIDESNDLYPWANQVLSGQDDATTSLLFKECCQKARTNYNHPNSRCDKDGNLSDSVTHIILKAPNLTYSAKKIAKHFPGSFCIFTFRDIRDVVVSMSKLSGIPMVENQLKLIKRETELLTRYSREIHELEKPDIQPHQARAHVAKIKMELRQDFNILNIKKLEVGYEELVHHPEVWLEKLLHHVELPLNLQESTHMKVMAGWGPGQNRRKSKVNTLSVGQWSNFLTPKQENEIWQIAKPIMKQLNYPRKPKVFTQAKRWDSIESELKYRPIIATGRGGSGTRLLSRLLQSLGVFLGNSMNGTEDSLEWAGLFYEMAIERTLQQPNQPNTRWRDSLRSVAAEVLATKNWDGHQPWGWKLPETMLILPEVFETFNQGIFIHIIRHPVDCSLRRTHVTSRANNPVGSAVLNAAYDSLDWEPKKITSDPSYLHNAASWFYQVQYASRFGREVLGPDRYLEIRYEDICLNPQKIVELLSDFLQIPLVSQTLGFQIDPNRQRDWSPPDPRANEVWEICGGLAMQLGYDTVDNSEYYIKSAPGSKTR